MSAQFKPGDRVRCIETWTTHVIDRGDEFTVDETARVLTGIDAGSNRVFVQGEWVPARYFEKVEPEDKDDLYVEPEPLKEGDAVLVWAMVTDPKPGEFGLTSVRLHGDDEDVYAYPGHVVRPDAGQVPPWLVLSPLEEPKGIGAVVEAEVRGSDRHSFVRVDTADGTPCRWRSTYDGCGYEWAALEEPTLTRVGVPEDGAS